MSRKKSKYPVDELVAHKRKSSAITGITIVITVIAVFTYLAVMIIPNYFGDILIDDNKDSSETNVTTPELPHPPQSGIKELEDTTFDRAWFETTTAMDDYYLAFDLDPSQHTYQGTVGQINYCPLDEFSRSVCAYGLLTNEMRATAKAEGRTQNLPNPKGWPKNSEVDIPALENISESKNYHGWFWNRSHLIADSLGGEAIVENLVIGTRTQNVGSTNIGGQYAGGMAAPEKIARDYLDSPQAKNCPLYYATTAHYEGSQMIPVATTVELDNCDNTVNRRFVIPNIANGFDIDYNTGTFTPWN